MNSDYNMPIISRFGRDGKMCVRDVLGVFSYPAVEHVWLRYCFYYGRLVAGAGFEPAAFRL